MKRFFIKYLKSPKVKKVFLVLAPLLILFFLFNDLLMPWYVDASGVIVVPPVVGLKFDDAKKLLDSLGFAPMKGNTRLDREHPEGIVIIQNPIDGSKVKRGRRIYLTVSGGEFKVIVPDLRGNTVRDAKFQLEREGLKLGAVEYQYSDIFPANTVIEQKIPPGAKVKRDVYISIVESKGSVAEKICVPDVTGKTLAEAVKILTEIGLKLGNATYIPSSDLLPNTVVDQYPRVGEMVIAGQSIDLIIVQGAVKKKDIFEN